MKKRKKWYWIRHVETCGDDSEKIIFLKYDQKFKKRLSGEEVTTKLSNGEWKKFIKILCPSRIILFQSCLSKIISLDSLYKREVTREISKQHFIRRFEGETSTVQLKNICTTTLKYKTIRNDSDFRLHITISKKTFELEHIALLFQSWSVLVSASSDERQLTIHFDR